MNGIGNVEAKEFKYTTHGHELRQGDSGRRVVHGRGG